MVEYQVVAVVILLISLILLSFLIYKILPLAQKWSKGAYKQAKYTFCCNILGCQPWYVLSWSKLNPLCPTVCWGCVCGDPSGC